MPRVPQPNSAQETDDRRLVNEWISHWNDIIDFEVIAVITSAEAVERIAPQL